jgi:hypothetical protein
MPQWHSLASLSMSAYYKRSTLLLGSVNYAKNVLLDMSCFILFAFLQDWLREED